jgi:hypothetical protein
MKLFLGSKVCVSLKVKERKYFKSLNIIILALVLGILDGNTLIKICKFVILILK